MPRITLAAAYFISLTTLLSSVSNTSAATSLSKSVSNATVTHNTTSISASSLLHLRCDGDLYKRNLRKRSCTNAQRAMIEDRDWFSVGPRGGPMLTDVELPYRWISDDGLCIFDVSAGRDILYEEVRMIDFRNAALALLRNCALGAGTLGEGGIVTGLGRAGRIGLIMTSFEPSVHCSKPPSRAPEPDHCWEILQLMPASIGLRWFGRQEDPGSGVSLPWHFANHDGTCLVTVETTGPPTKESWYHIWEQMVAIVWICTLHEMEGTAFELGANKKIFVHMERDTSSVATS